MAGHISLTRLQLGPIHIAFVLDTGADITMLHPGDAFRLGVDFHSHFQGSQSVTIPGVGTAQMYWEEATLELPHLDGRVDRFTGNVLVAIPTNTNRRHPSLLGRDVFDHYSIVYNRNRNILLLQ